MSRTGTHQDTRKRVELTGRQHEVIQLMARGYTNSQIGAALGISLDGAKWHVSEIIGKLDASSREEAVDFWRSYNSTGARMSRMLNSFVSAGLLRWAAGGTAALVVAGASVFAIALATNGGDSDPASDGDSTATPTPQLTETGTPVGATTGTPSASPSPDASATPGTGNGQPTPDANDERTELLVYLFHGENLSAVHRDVPQTQAVGRAALEDLFAGPNDDDENIGLSSTIPSGTELLGLTINDGVATVDVSAEFESGGGSLSMQGRLAQVVYTLTQFATVDAVLFQIEGETVEVFGGEGILLDGPVDRGDFEDITPAILVESPANWETVTSPVRITGTANTFEATFMVNVVDNEGLIVAESVVTATSGTGTRGTFDITLPFELSREGLGSIIVFENSAQDGSQVNIAETRVYFEE